MLYLYFTSSFDLRPYSSKPDRFFDIKTLTTKSSLKTLLKSCYDYRNTIMDFIGNLIINSVCMAILLVILFANLKSCKGGMLSCHIFKYILITGIILFVVDTIGRMDGATDVSIPLLNSVGNFLLFVLNPVVPILWVIYVAFQIQGGPSFLKKNIWLFVSFFLAHLSIVILNLFFGFYYTIDANNVYSRGPFFAASVLWAFVPLIVAFFVTTLHRDKIDQRKFNAFVLFPLSPIFGTILSFVSYGYSVILPTMTIALMLVFNSIQNDSMRVDYLTGVFNRRHLEECLRKKMSEPNNVFAGIMLDIDNYKSVNDTYGHLFGDRALIDFASALQKSVGKNDIVARYGGDEFMLIVNVKNEEQLEEVIFDIAANIEKINNSEVYPFKLHASIGAKIYTRDKETTMEKFLNQLDDLMYRDKKRPR